MRVMAAVSRHSNLKPEEGTKKYTKHTKPSLKMVIIMVTKRDERITA